MPLAEKYPDVNFMIPHLPPARGISQCIRDENGPAPRLPLAGPPLPPVEGILQEAAEFWPEDQATMRLRL